MSSQDSNQQIAAENTADESNNVKTGSPNSENEHVHRKGNEDRKIFVGGIAYDVTNDDLQQHFSSFGEVTQAQVKFDRTTGRSRGFAFVEFVTTEACNAALKQREQTIKNKTVEVKPAKSRENKKVFVGGLPADYPEDELRRYFEQYGVVEDIEWPFDKMTKVRRNFAFIVFEDEESVDRASAVSRQTFGSRECDVKKAVPQNKRLTPFVRSMPSLRGVYPNGIRNGAIGIQNAAQWYGQNWGQVTGIPYAANGAAAWGEWYNNQANFYATAPPNGTSGPAYGAGYDYTQSPANIPRPQAAPAAAVAANRYQAQY